MQAKITSFWEWQQHFADEKSCLQAIINLRWPEGFCCPRCGHQKGWLLQTHHGNLKSFVVSVAIQNSKNLSTLLKRGR
ncbi:transposase [Methylomonas sp. LL1]|uniref:transposase n=1 Tax=Methylomonas sp. LL1 TaxID=2785785 RepID=UPI003FA5EA34